MDALPQTPNGAGAIRPRGVSGDGNVIIGQVFDNVAGLTAFVWTPALGTQLLTSHLASRGVNMAGWQITDATAISADGRAMCGIGIFGGQSVGWVVSGLPCPVYGGWVAGGLTCPSDPVGISVQATGTLLTYRWFRNGVQLFNGVQPSGSIISGATTNYITFAGYVAADAGTYRVAVGSAGACEILSTNIPMGARNPFPTITANPQNNIVCAGYTLSLISGATWPGAMTLRWERENFNFPGTYSAIFDGPTGYGSTLSGTGTATIGDAQRYRLRAIPTICIPAGNASSSVSAPALVTVIAGNSFTFQPQDTSVCIGPGSANFFVAASPPSDTFTYQWQKKNSIFLNVYNDLIDGPTGNGGSYSGTQTQYLTIAGVYASDIEYYRCIVTGTCLSMTSNDAYLSELPYPAVTSGPTGGDGCAFGTAALAITASPAGSTYQWQQYVGPCILCYQDVADGPTGNGGTFVGAQTPTLTINGLQLFDTFTSFRCIVTSPCPNTQPAASPDAFFTLKDAPVFQTQPTGGPVCKNGTKVMTVALAPGNYGTVSYQWWRFVPAFPIFAGVPNGTLPSGAIVSGATSPSITISNFKPQDAGQYYCKATGDCGDVFSSVVTLTSCPADFNCSGAVTVQDIFDFLATYFASNPTADFNNSSTISVQDIFDFLAAYFAGC